MEPRTTIQTDVNHQDEAPARGTTRLATIMIIGATRGTGREVMRQALAGGHPVVTLVRDPARLSIPQDISGMQLRVVCGDVMDAASLLPALSGCDAVISTLGVTGRRATTLYSAGMRNIIRAMQVAGVRRLLAVSASPLADDTGDTWLSRRVLTPLISVVLQPVYADMARMEEEMRHSDLDWTIVRPPRLTDGAPRGSYRLASDRRVRGGYLISRVDLAAALLRLLDDPTSYGTALGIAY